MAGQVGYIGHYNGHEKYKQPTMDIITVGKNTNRPHSTL
jgi:hypothetical protein